jgi:hypothetical protein
MLLEVETMIHQRMTNQVMEECIGACEQCHRTCLQMAMTYCLATGGEHVQPEHFRLMMSCAEICQTAANFMASGSEFHNRVCGVCAEICEACARSCGQIRGMDDCVAACKRCAESCRKMTSAAQ